MEVGGQVVVDGEVLHGDLAQVLLQVELSVDIGHIGPMTSFKKLGLAGLGLINSGSGNCRPLWLIGIRNSSPSNALKR